jgi:type IV secretion system protein VirD4
MRWRVLFLALALSLAATLAWAEVPRPTLQRLADIRVELAELRHLNAIEQLTHQQYIDRLNALTNEQAALWAPYGRSPQDDLTNARNTINGLVNAKLSLLVPQWQQAEAQFRAAREQQKKQLNADIEDDARRAAELQRQRLNLQQQLDAGALTRDAFTVRDRQALDGIAALRKKYEDIGGFSPQQFDNQLAQATKAIVASPAKPLPQSQVPLAGAVPESPPDFNADVKLAATIAVKQQELHFQFEKQQVSSDAFRESDVVYDRDLSRLKMRYQATSVAREQEFENAYRRLAAPEIQALRVQYYPAQYRPAIVAAPAPAPQSSGISGGTMAVIVILLLGAVVGIVFVLRRKRVDPVPPLTKNYGSASYAPLETEPRSRANTASGVFLGKSSEPARRNAGLDGPGAPIVTTREHHTLIVARTRTGKGTRVIVPTLLRYAGNMFVIDPKGENTAITARTRRDTLNQTVHILNPWGHMAKLYEGYGFTPAAYNPLDIIDRNDPNAVADARRLAGAICPVTGRGNDAFWQQSAANILAAVFLWLADQPGETKTLARAREIVTLDRKTFTDQFLVKMAASTAYHGAVAEMMRRFIDLADNTYTGITASLQTATDFISDPQLKKATNSSTFSMAELRDQPTTLYLIPPDEIETQKTWLRLLVAAATRSFRRPARAGPPVRCMMLIDEFPALGKLQDLPTEIATMAGYGLDYTLVVQGIDRLKAIYQDDRGAILSNCAFKWYCNVTDLETAKHVSDSLGEATIGTVGKSTSSGTAGGGGSTEGESTTYGEKGRKLLTPDEVINLGKDVAIVFQPEGLPMYVKPIDYWNLTKAFAHLAPSHPELYWAPPLTYDENPYFKKEPPPRKPGLSEKEAREILGVAATATRDDIYAAYKRLMLKVHPDTGGSNHFARQLNEAKEVLLNS